MTSLVFIPLVHLKVQRPEIKIHTYIHTYIHTSWNSEHMQKEGLFGGCPGSAHKYFNPQSTVLFELSVSGMLSNVLTTMDRCKGNQKSFLSFIYFPDIWVLWSEVLHLSSQNGTSNF